MGSPRKQRAFSLVEVLIALIIMSVGMLGIAGLYVHSLQAGRTSLFRHHAIHLAGDVADRIRANPNGGIAYMHATGVNNDCVAANIDCDVVEMARNDVWLWKQQAGNTLPGSAPTGGGDVAVNFDDTVVPPVYTITVSWEEPGDTPQYQIAIPVNPF